MVFLAIGFASAGAERRGVAVPEWDGDDARWHEEEGRVPA
jgi:hypothetical protein